MRIIETITEYREQADCRTAAQMELICCEEAPALPCCEVSRPWGGYSSDEVFEMLNLDLDNEGRDSQGRYVYIEFAERGIPCGEEVIDYDLRPGNCCDDVEEITIDTESSPDVLPARYTVNVYWDGGRPPFTVTTSNTGTYFANYKREIVTAASWVEITALESFCGATVITIGDGCSAKNWILRSDHGQWELLGELCVLPNATGHVAAGEDEIRELVSGNLKQREELTRGYWWRNGIKCPVVNGDPPELCLPDCEDSVCAALEAVRPPGAGTDTCMDIVPAQILSVTSYCSMADKTSAVIHPVYTGSYACSGDVGFGSGATGLFSGLYHKTGNLYAYQWVC